MAKINKRKQKQLQKRSAFPDKNHAARKDTFRRILLFGWMGLLLILPYLQAKTFYVHSAPKFFVTLIAIIFLSAVAIIGLLQKQLSWPRIPWEKPLFLYSLVIIAATLFSVDRHISFFGAYPNFSTGLLSYILCLFFFYLVLISRPSLDEIKKFLKLFVFSGIFIALHATLERYGVPHIGRSDVVFDGRAVGVFGNADYTLSYLLFVLPLVIYFASEEKKYISRGLYISAIIIVFFSLFLLVPLNLQAIITKILFSIPGLISIVTLAMAMVCLRQKPVQRFIRQIGYKKICLAALGLFCLLGPLLYKTLSGPAKTFLNSPANEQRFWAWKAGLEMGKEHFLLGTGPGTISYFLPSFQKKNPTTTWNDNVTTGSLHNEMIDHFATMGILGLIGYLLLWGSFFFLSKKIINQSCPEKKLITTICLSVLLFIGFNQFFFVTAGTMLLSWLAAALVFVLSDKAIYNLPKQLNPVSLVLSAIISILIASFLLFWGIRYWVADYYYGKTSEASEDSYLYSEKSVKNFPFIDAYWQHYGYSSYYDPLVGKLKKYNLTLSKDNQKIVLLNSAEALKKSVEIRPKQAANWTCYGLVLLRLKEFDSSYEARALEAFSKSLELESNNNIYTYLRIANTYELMGDFEMEESYLEKAKSISTEKTKYDLTIAYADIYLVKGDKEKALLEYEKALNYALGSTRDELKIYIAKLKRFK